MKRLLILLPSLACALTLSACGGGGLLPPIGSPYQGTWSGTWAGTNDGTVFFTINIVGELDGSMHSNTSGEDGPLNGLILDNGNTTVTVSFPSESPTLGTGVLTMNVEHTTMTGTLVFDGDEIAFDLTLD